MPTLGEYLKSEREKKNVSLEQVASSTRINLKTLSSMECDDFGHLPAKPFLRGFIISYCRFIKIDPKDVLVEFNDYIERKIAALPKKYPTENDFAIEAKERDQNRTILWVVMTSMIVVGGIVILILKPNLKHKRHTKDQSPVAAVGSKTNGKPATSAELPNANSAKLHGIQLPTVMYGPSTAPAVLSEDPPKVTPEPVAKIEKPIASPLPKKEEEVASSSEAEDPVKLDPLQSGKDLTPADIKYKVTFRATDDVWVRYQIDEKQKMLFILRKDRTLVLRGKETIRFQTSNAGGLQVRYNRPDFKPMNNALNLKSIGEAPTLVFSSQDAEIVETSMKSWGNIPKEVPLPKIKAENE